jgi:hypothetical protein
MSRTTVQWWRELSSLRVLDINLLGHATIVAVAHDNAASGL